MEKSHFKYIGVDPGVSGGLVVIDNGNIIAEKCPKKVVDMAAIFQAAIGSADTDNVRFLMERVWARPNNASSRAFTYGVNYGQWLGIAASLEVKTYTELPNNWMKWFGCPKGMISRDRKNWLKDKAKELYPQLKKITLATADAILIAHYGKEEYFNGKKE